MRNRNLWEHLIGDESGVTALEYGLIAALIFLVILGAVQVFSGSVTDMFNTVSNTVSNSL